MINNLIYNILVIHSYIETSTSFLVHHLFKKYFYINCELYNLNIEYKHNQILLILFYLIVRDIIIDYIFILLHDFLYMYFHLFFVSFIKSYIS
jgi:hypothetical protein